MSQVIANTVLDVEKGTSLERCHLMQHRNPNIKTMRTTSLADEFGRLFQCVGKGNQDGKRIKGINTFFFIHHRQIPHHNIKDIKYARIVYTIRDMKKNRYRTKITVGGNNVKCHGDVGTPTAHVETAKPLFNSMISHPSAKCMTIDLANFYLMTLMKNYECLCVKLKHFPQEIIDELKLHKLAHNEWVC